MVNMKVKSTSAVHREFNDAMKAVLAQFKDRLTGIEMLAVASHLVGVLIAVQDQRRVTREMALDLVAKNIEAGNAEAIESLHRTEGNA